MDQVDHEHHAGPGAAALDRPGAAAHPAADDRGAAADVHAGPDPAAADPDGARDASPGPADHAHAAAPDHPVAAYRHARGRGLGSTGVVVGYPAG